METNNRSLLFVYRVEVCFQSLHWCVDNTDWAVSYECPDLDKYIHIILFIIINVLFWKPYRGSKEKSGN
jgi:hypothetical protein